MHEKPVNNSIGIEYIIDNGFNLTPLTGKFTKRNTISADNIAMSPIMKNTTALFLDPSALNVSFFSMLFTNVDLYFFTSIPHAIRLKKDA